LSADSRITPASATRIPDTGSKERMSVRFDRERTTSSRIGIDPPGRQLGTHASKSLRETERTDQPSVTSLRDDGDPLLITILHNIRHFLRILRLDNNPTLTLIFPHPINIKPIKFLITSTLIKCAQKRRLG